jgi:hypothetical protein
LEVEEEAMAVEECGCGIVERKREEVVVRKERGG